MTVVTLTTVGLNNWTVPAGVNEILVELFGGQGGAGANGGSAGGEGGTVAFTLRTIPGEKFLFAVGAAGATASATGATGFTTNGGYGYGGRGYYGAGAGGSFTGMYATVGAALYALAAGGGGGTPSVAGRDGGAGGPSTGQQGFPQSPYISTPGGGEGGSQTTPGRQGFGDGGSGGNAGYGTQGGDGDASSTANRGGPGGGAGFRGGGGGGRGDASNHGSGGGGGSNHIATGGGFMSTPVAVTNATGGNTGAGWARITYTQADPCSLFEGLIAGIVASTDVSLSVASTSLPGFLADYRISFFDDTTSGATPSASTLAGGPWSIGQMDPGEHIRYAITRIDGAHIDGSCVMRATDTVFGMYWDLTVQCTPFARQALVF